MLNLYLKNIKISILLIFFISITSCITQFESKLEKNSYSENERVVLYYPAVYAYSKRYHIDFSKISHLNLWFFNPDREGNFLSRGNKRLIKRYIKQAQKSGVKVYLSIGGGAVTTKNSYGKFYIDIQENEKYSFFIDKILQLLKEYKADGIDLDLEGKVVGENYSNLIVNLSKELKKLDYGLSGAFNIYSGRRVNDEAIKCFDIINSMAYNESGLWDNGLKDHSSIEDSQKHLNYWVKDRGVAKEKVVLGVPFYGWFKKYDLEGNLLDQGAIVFNQLSYIYRCFNLEDDWIELKTKTCTTQITFNNLETIKNKRELARNYGGIMVWQYTQDSRDKKLFNAIIEN